MNAGYDICAIITAYYPDESILKNISRLEEQVSTIIIADNTPYVDNSEMFGKYTKVLYRSNKINLGLSMAFNQCFSLACVKNSDFIFFLDQDSLISENLVEVLVKDYIGLLERNINVGCLGPLHLEKNSNQIISPSIRHVLPLSLYKVDTMITSSMLTTYNRLSRIGFWSEDIFLDWADWDLCFKFNQLGFHCCLSKRITLKHKLGKSTKRILCFSLRDDNPVRTYYQVRDGLKLFSKSYCLLKYKIKLLINIFIRQAMHIFFLDEKLKRAKYFFHGIVDYILSKNGAWEQR
jgi:rhamnosyltransferase